MLYHCILLLKGEEQFHTFYSKHEAVAKADELFDQNPEAYVSVEDSDGELLYEKGDFTSNKPTSESGF